MIVYKVGQIINWINSYEHISENNYQLVLKVDNKNCEIESLWNDDAIEVQKFDKSEVIITEIFCDDF